MSRNQKSDKTLVGQKEGNKNGHRAYVSQAGKTKFFGEKIPTATTGSKEAKFGKSLVQRLDSAGKDGEQNLNEVVVDVDKDSRNEHLRPSTPGVTITSPEGKSETKPSALSAPKDDCVPESKSKYHRAPENKLKQNGHLKQSKSYNIKTPQVNSKDKKNKHKQCADTKVPKTSDQVVDTAPSTTIISEARKHWEMIKPKEIIAMAACENWDKPNGTLAAPNTELRGSLLDLPASNATELDNVSIVSRQTSLRSFDTKSIDMSRVQAAIDAATAAANNKGDESKDYKPKVTMSSSHDTLIRSAIPYMPVWLAVICLILNIFIPGFGTIVSGLAIPCTGKTRIPSKEDHVFVTLCLNVWVGVAQLFTVTFLLVGWFWSMAWGFILLVLALEHKKEQEERRQKEIQARALTAFGEIRPFSLRP